MIFTNDLAIPLERITWTDGQQLDARDVRDSVATAERFRHLHIRYQHKTWGVVEGLLATAAGSSAVEVRIGYALDIEGAEILLPVATSVPVPSSVIAPTTMYLVISRSAGESCGCQSDSTPDLSLLCPGIRSTFQFWAGTLAWKTLAQVRVGLDVLLARVAVSKGQISGNIDTSVRRRARSMAQPKLWYESTPIGQAWTAGMDAWVRNVSTVVDTSNAGFVAAPAYFAWLSGPTDGTTGYISASGVSRFTFTARPLPNAERWGADIANSQGWTVQWLGVELPPAEDRLDPFVHI